MQTAPEGESEAVCGKLARLGREIWSLQAEIILGARTLKLKLNS